MDRASTSARDRDNVFLRGWLKKQSGGLLGLMQNRYCLVSRDDFRFYYYKGEGDEREAGSIDCGHLSFARISDPSRGCCKFEVKTASRAGSDERTYVFECRNSAEATVWLDAINTARDGGAMRPSSSPSIPPPSSSSSSNVRISGYLQKRSPNPLVLRPQRRFFSITESDNTLRYFKQESDAEPVGALRLDDLQHARRLDGSRFELKLYNSERVFVLEAPSVVEMIMWIDACGAHSKGSLPGPLSAASSGPLTPLMHGYVGKRSHNKYVRSVRKLQRRFLVITKEDSCLRYYRAAEDWGGGAATSGGVTGPPALGCCDLRAAEFVRVYDKSPGCRMFEVGEADGRVLAFECLGEGTMAGGAGPVPSAEEEMWCWIDCIEDRMAEGLRADVAEQAEKARKDTPASVLLFDDQGKEAFFEQAQAKMGALLQACHAELEAAAEAAAEAAGESESGKVSEEYLHRLEEEAQRGAQGLGVASWDDAWDSGDDEEDECLAGSKALRAYAAYARGMIGYFNSSLPDFQKHPRHPARYDIMCLFITEFNAAFSNGLAPALLRGSSILAQAQLHDLLPIITLLSQHEARLNTLYCPAAQCVVTSAQGRRSTYFEQQVKFSCPLFSDIPHLCIRYTEGSGASPGLGQAFCAHALRCWEGLLQAPAEHLRRHQDGSFFTSLPTDTWTAFHQQLLLGSASGCSPVLHAVIAQKVGAALEELVGVQRVYAAAYVVAGSAPAPAAAASAAAGAAAASTGGGAGGGGGTWGGSGPAEDDLSEFELEFFCSLANDFALHVEEILILMQRFELGAVRDQLEASFDGVTQALVAGGQACLDVLVAMVMSDVQDPLSRIFTRRWLDAPGDMEAVLVTLGDYMRDFRSYLLPFWSAKFVQALLEEVVVQYTWSVLRWGAERRRPKEVSSLERARGALESMTVSFSARMESLYRSASAAAAAATASSSSVAAATTSSSNSSSSSTSSSSGGSTAELEAEEEEKEGLQGPCVANAETLGRLSRDINALNAFFHSHMCEAESSAVLQLINEVLLLSQSEAMKAVAHAVRRVAEYPSSAAAIVFTAQQCLALREDVDDAEYDECCAALRRALQGAEDLAKYNEANGVCEPGRLGLMFVDLAAKGGATASIAAATAAPAAAAPTAPAAASAPSVPNSLAQRLRIMANLPMLSLRAAVTDMVEQEEDEEAAATTTGQGGGGAHRLTSGSTLLSRDAPTPASPAAAASTSIPPGSDSPGSSPTRQLISDVLSMHQTQQQEAAREAALAVRRARQREQEEDSQRQQAGNIFAIEGRLDKQSPSIQAFAVWQNRFFRLAHRLPEAEGGGGRVQYTLLWYKKRGGTVLKSLPLTHIVAISLVSSARSVRYSKLHNRIAVDAEYGAQEGERVGAGETLPVAPLEEARGEGSYVFAITCLEAPDASGSRSKIHLLRGSSVDKMIRWVNTLAGAAQLSFDEVGRHGFVKR